MRSGKLGRIITATVVSLALEGLQGVPAQAATASSVSAGAYYTCALTTSGGVKCWGNNGLGELGDGTNTDSNVPVEVTGLPSGVAQVSAGGYHTCALTTSGGVKCWGDNGYGELGDGTHHRRKRPVSVVGLASGVRAASAGGYHTCALTTSGGVKCWGDNGYGELGDGSNTDSKIPVEVTGLASGVMAVSAAGGYRTCALTTSGGVKCWGYNGYGELGDGTHHRREWPVSVVGLASGVAEVSAGGYHTCALTTSGGVKCWGYNAYGELGDGTHHRWERPVSVVGLTVKAPRIKNVAPATATASVTTVTITGKNLLHTTEASFKGVPSASFRVVSKKEDKALVPAGATTGKVTVTEPPCIGAGGIAWYAGTGFYESNPTYTDPTNDTSSWKFSTPEAQNMNSTTLQNGVNSLASSNALFSVIVIRHGYIVSEAYFHGATAQSASNVHSASKSMMQALIGIAIQKGYIRSLHDKVSEYLPQYLVNAPASEKNMTIEDLLSMASGLHWVEDNTEYTLRTNASWVQAILGQRMHKTPGTTFHYSTGNFHVLSALLSAATGMSTCDFAGKYLFSQTGHGGITPEHWGFDPTTNVDMGGCDLYMTAREMAKFGLLYLNSGIANGVQVVPRSTVRQAQQLMFKVGNNLSYAQGWWLRTISGHKMYFAWGWGGQFIYVIPNLDIVFVTTENTADGFHNKEINSGAFIKNYLIPSITGP